jgi:hypothetical protein
MSAAALSGRGRIGRDVCFRGEWYVEHDGNAAHTYATKEAAFEASVAAASLAMWQGHEIVIAAPGTTEGDASVSRQS